MKNFYILVYLLALNIALLVAQNEFYINGAEVYINNKVNTTVPTLYVNGNINNNDGNFTNAVGLIEITGNWTNTVPTNNYVSTGIERFTGTSNQQINGTWNGTTANSNQFYDLEVYKTSTTGQIVSLNSNVNVNSAGSLNFTGTNGIIRTDASSHADDGSAYPNELYLQNPANAKFSGYSTGNGATTKYIEGKLRRQINNTGIHYFPIGVALASLDGMEAFELNFTANPNMDYVGYIQPATQDPLNRNILCDVGEDPGTGIQQFSGCAGSPDGIYDLYYLEAPMDLSHEWIATPSGSTSGYNYGITLHPGNVLDVNNAANYYTIPNSCGAPYQTQRLRIVAKDGIVGGNAQTGPDFYSPFSSFPSYLWCQFDNSDLDITLDNQTSFSDFRIHGTNLNSNTLLPVELIALNATPIENRYINVSWITASETNNLGFEVWRSTDAVNFSLLGFLDGNGTTNQLHHYSYDDLAVQTGITYYYKLKQIDFDYTFHFTYIVSAKLNPSDVFTLYDISPNPTFSDAYIDIYSPTDNTLSYSIYNDIGQEVVKKEININKGLNTVPILSNDLAKTTYFVSFVYEEKIYYKKLIKL